MSGAAEAERVAKEDALRALAPFDVAVLTALLEGGGCAPSYVLRNRMSMRKVGNFRTDRVLAALRRLETVGLVRRVDTAYLNMYCWQANDIARAALADQAGEAGA